MARVHSLFHAATDLLLGATCPGCNRPGWGLCARCRQHLDPHPELIDRGLDIPLAAAAQYRPILEHVIPRYKDDGAWHLGAPLGDLLADAVAALDPPDDALLVPVPSLPSAVRTRGIDHAAQLASRAARRLGLRSRRLLVRRQVGADQHGLARAQRNANLAHTMQAARTTGPLVLIDDVATSGASLREAVRALRRAGNTLVGAAVVAQAEKLPQHSAKARPPTWPER